MSVWTTPTTRSLGLLVTPAIWNTDLVDNLKYLKASPVFDGRVYVGAIGSALAGVNVLSGGQAGGVQIIRNASALVTSGQSLGALGWKGTDSANSNAAAEAMIEAVAAENYSATAAGTDLLFYTKPIGTGPGSSPTAWLRLTSAGHLYLSATKQLYFDGGSNTYLEEVSADNLRAVAGGNERLRVVGANGVQVTGAVTIPTGTPLYLDGSFTGNTYLMEIASDSLALVAGGNERLRAVGANGVQVTGGLTITSGSPLYFDGSFSGNTYVDEVTGDSLRFVCGGNERLRIVGANGVQVSGALTVPSATPIYLDGSFSGDTYLYQASNDNVDVVTGGVTRWRWSSSGHVAIAATARIYLDGTGAAGNTYLLESSADVMRAIVGGETRMEISSAGRTVLGSTAATILDDAGDSGSMVVVQGGDGSNDFLDIVVAGQFTAPVVVTSYAVRGTPTARTYTRSGIALQLAMASGTYTVVTIKLGT